MTRHGANRNKYCETAGAFEKAVTKKDYGALAVTGAWRTVARKATPTAFYWLVLSLTTFLGMSTPNWRTTNPRRFVVLAAFVMPTVKALS
jgi:hypothetical protein